MRKEIVLSEKGQITLPKDIRDAVGLKPNDKVMFTVDDGRLILTPKTLSFSDLAGFLGSPPNGPATLDEIEETIASAASETALKPRKTSKGQAA
ncbi:MAG: AbrB/MazE/SpoVT family DNA-binding domain-containing protein [Hoeflea sp.]|uniref:AbrB/MazE/SpoVT family DNA-binding domain-containing protein n=1 Tax=Hoeflea sp. TaxID=1940281 RepID=UPI001D384652|nr:AbrB/MazE/SpoVT family DNA-binding domain-containing protein [Hoeflea sp.]MBU4530772.1 AbrB/MazE/SpoVT family DNA-binding domain-containing protein [Alphaproteobacteria bacterium]MBU4544771.1 AbrB/MazE/SpoVT family DNA-binding domain-containing protein [Alphaproteobacteria bacterium]MBU4549327.1 AbrB/MazE/SpoVT family DNA-binding domain-containing protein [Alphaproteobacteria bacterium]MBV1726366.1 AbrB/MazE/SpoVT family DNA-binding domain-containing protein [Hoeflea sp.]MBV1761708.1 AbrB/M